MKQILLAVLAVFTVSATSAQLPCTNMGFNATMAPTVNDPLRVAVSTTNAIPLPPHSWGFLAYTWGDNGTFGYTPLPASSGATVYHSYSAPGSYSIIQRIYVYDSSFNATICVDSNTQLFTVAAAPCATSISHTQSNNTFTFTANNLASTPGMTYTWDFGDGSTGTGSPVTHSYNVAGNYTVTLVALAGPPAGCAYTTTKNVTAGNPPPPPLNCSALSAGFTTNVINKTVIFTNTSSTVSAPATRSFLWHFGDGATSTQQSPTHNYAFASNYTVRLITQWTNSSSQCSDTIISTVSTTNPPPPPNKISGGVVVDTADLDSNMSFMVWLIKHDSVANTLTAVDSTIAVYQGNTAFHYEFNNKPAGSYLVKAHLLNGPSSGTGYIPTYHLYYLHWSQANTIAHTGGYSAYYYIVMQKGTVTNGPGFVGGNISQGANKGTGAGLGNMLIIIQDNNNKAIRSTFTDGNGNYSVGNLPVGNYSVYPEDLGYNTTPASVSITNGKPSVIDINFERSYSNKSIVPVATGISNTTAQQLAVYPNPSRGMIYIQSNMDMNNAAVNVADVTGRTVISTTVQNNSIDMNNLQDGLYYITIETDAASYTQKVMILH